MFEVINNLTGKVHSEWEDKETARKIARSLRGDYVVKPAKDCPISKLT